MANPPKIFVSYSHKDKVWLDRLQEQFAPLARGALLVAWDDTQIAPGTKWREEIARAIDEADIAVLLVSSGFLASDFIDKHELKPLLAKKHVFWIAVSPSLYEMTEIAQYQAANDPAKPLASLKGAARTKALVETCKKILAVAANHVGSNPVQHPGPPAQAAMFPQAERLSPINMSGEPPRKVVERLEAEKAVVAQNIYARDIYLGEGALKHKSPEPPEQAAMFSQAERVSLLNQLNAVTTQQFNIFIYTLKPPDGIIPPMPAPQSDRVIALLYWAEAPGGCGLAHVKQTFDKILNPP